MDPAQFAADTPGKLVPMQLRRREWAYVPDELPVSWEFAGEFWPLLAQAKEALGTLNGIGQTLPDPQLLVAS